MVAQYLHGRSSKRSLRKDARERSQNVTGIREWYRMVPQSTTVSNDTALLHESAEQFQYLTEFGRLCDRRKLIMNEDNIKIMVLGRGDNTPR